MPNVPILYKFLYVLVKPSAAIIVWTSAILPLPVIANDKTKTTCIASQEFCSSIEVLSEKQTKAMVGVVWQKGCPVQLAELRVVNATHRTFNGSIAVGSVVVHQQYAKPVAQALRQMFEASFPIESMLPMEAFGGDDERAQVANNTSAFNCRVVKGSKVFSQHAYGRAIDINPLQNPFVKKKDSSRKTPDQQFVDRVAAAKKPGVIGPQSVPVKAFKQIGWSWGGNWRVNKDYQHFSATNR
jgi:D-alanyl-D-alanine carboxypeptidase